MYTFASPIRESTAHLLRFGIFSSEGVLGKYNEDLINYVATLTSDHLRIESFGTPALCFFLEPSRTYSFWLLP